MYSCVYMHIHTSTRAHTHSHTHTHLQLHLHNAKIMNYFETSCSLTHTHRGHVHNTIFFFGITTIHRTDYTREVNCTPQNPWITVNRRLFYRHPYAYVYTNIFTQTHTPTHMYVRTHTQSHLFNSKIMNYCESGCSQTPLAGTISHSIYYIQLLSNMFLRMNASARRNNLQSQRIEKVNSISEFTW